MMNLDKKLTDQLIETYPSIFQPVDPATMSLTPEGMRQAVSRHIEEYPEDTLIQTLADRLNA